MNQGLATTACLALPNVLPQTAVAFDSPPKNNLPVIGPMGGYSPQIGTLVSRLNDNRDTIIQSVKNLTQPQLDFLFDTHANTVGGLLMHLVAVEKYYQINSFEGRPNCNDTEKKEWDAGLELGETGRNEIKGHPVQLYLDKLAAVRAKTLEEPKKKTINGSWNLTRSGRSWSPSTPTGSGSTCTNTN